MIWWYIVSVSKTCIQTFYFVCINFNQMSIINDKNIIRRCLILTFTFILHFKIKHNQKLYLNIQTWNCIVDSWCNYIAANKILHTFHLDNFANSFHHMNRLDILRLKKISNECHMWPCIQYSYRSAWIRYLKTVN